MKLIAMLLAAWAGAFAADTIRVFDREWSVPFTADWNIDQQDGGAVLRLAKGREPLQGPRRPFQFALADTPDFSRVTVEADVKPLGSSLMIVFAYRDAAHFNYAHLSRDTGMRQPMHNGVFHVFGGERVRISSQKGPGAFAERNRWYRVKLTHDASTGSVDVEVDGAAVPALHAVDLSLGAGKVGLGSFDETGEFRNVKINGAAVSGLQ